MNVLSAPKDSVAYDLIQSMTGMLKGREPAPQQAPAPAAEPEPRTAATAPAVAAPPPPIVSPIQPTPRIEPAASPPPLQPEQSPSRASGPPAPEAATAVREAPAPESIADRVRRTTELARKAAASTAALAATRVLSLNDRAEAPICGAIYRIEVTSVEAGRGAVALRGAGAPITLVVGEKRDVRAGCRVELISAMDDIANRRAQLRETKTP